jgi:predicted DNA-binding protein (MmcQ/YjbR family)
MNIEELREYCVAKPFVEEIFPFDEDTLVFKVMAKFLSCQALASVR